MTYADYKNWNPDETGRYELIYGTVHAMSAPTLQHQEVLTQLLVEIGTFLRGKPCKVYAAPVDVRLFYEEDESDDTVVQPDLIVICDEKKRRPEACRGAPEFAVEILAPSNTASEMERKFELYRQAGVGEYWVIDPQNKILHAHHFHNGQILTRFFGKNDRAPIETLQGLEITLAAVFAE
ncbi:MAG: Uma2 family endonuclease [Treponema sp.]|jgi:Uma2 family endonuclease|nr:Uma2 family endonuclease [Treponema sp.]